MNFLLSLYRHMRLGERILNGAERKFGKLAFPGILKWIAGFQLFGLILVMFSKGFYEMVEFDRGQILAGEVWRLFSWLALPAWFSFLYLILVLFIFFLNDVLEEAMGTFRLNLFVIGTAVCLIVAGMFLPFPTLEGSFAMRPIFLYAMVMAAACIIPNYIINLWMIIPIKMKWIGWIDVAMLISIIFNSSRPAIMGVQVVIGLIPFFIGILPAVLNGLKNEATATARRAKFQRSTEASGAFHSCAKCGVTDVKDPDMEFRVSGEDGKEYCLLCREKSG